MRKPLTVLAVVSGVSAMLSPAMGGYLLENGGMEDPFSSDVAVPWTYYQGGGGLGGLVQAKETTIVHGGLSSQKLRANVGSGGALARIGIRQTIDANVGDAFTFGGWVWPLSAGTYNETSIRVAWDGATTAPDDYLMNWLPLGTQKQMWHQMTTSTGATLAGGNATANSVTIFLHSRRYSSNGDLLTYWDDVVGYHAFVPPAATVGNQTASTFDVDVNPGDNSSNLFSQFAVTVGGGAYTLGSNWLQADGSVGSSPVWRTDAQWGTTTVTGLENTAYTVQVKARYSSTVPQETYLGAEVVIPEPVTVALFGLGILVVIRRR